MRRGLNGVCKITRKTLTNSKAHQMLWVYSSLESCYVKSSTRSDEREKKREGAWQLNNNFPHSQCSQWSVLQCEISVRPSRHLGASQQLQYYVSAGLVFRRVQKIKLYLPLPCNDWNKGDKIIVLLVAISYLIPSGHFRQFIDYHRLSIM